MNPRARMLLAAALVAGAVFALLLDGRRPAPDPTPPEPLAFTLRGKFSGTTGPDDAMLVQALCSELADEIAWDGKQAEPLFKTGVQLDALRTRARELRCRGESIGDRQPAVRTAIHEYLDSTIGVAGGPVSDQQRAKWVEAYRAVSRAAADALR